MCNGKLMTRLQADLNSHLLLDIVHPANKSSSFQPSSLSPLDTQSDRLMKTWKNEIKPIASQ